MTIDTRRRAFVFALGGASLAWPLVARAQQRATPVIGYFNSRSLGEEPQFLDSFRQGLSEGGYVEGRNVAIEFWWAEGQYDRLPVLAADLVHHQVAVIFANFPTVLAAKAATATIPIVFTSSSDPVNAGIVASLNRPGANVTGVSLLGTALEAKRLELLYQAIPGAKLIGVLVNPKNPDNDLQVRELQDAAVKMERQIYVVGAGTVPDVDTAFAILAQRKAGGLVVTSDPFFTSRSEQLVALTIRDKLPAIYNQRVFTEHGGLISYGSNLVDGYRQAGIYVGKILDGARPGELPVAQPTKFELVINLITAKALGLEIPAKLLALADQVIE